MLVFHWFYTGKQETVSNTNDVSPHRYLQDWIGGFPMTKINEVNVGFSLVLQGTTGNRQKYVLVATTLHARAGIRTADHWKPKGFQ